MNAPVRKPRVDDAISKLRDALKDEPSVCPFCKGTSWRPALDLVNIPAFTDEDPQPDTDDVGWAVFHALVLICENCGFVRLHAVAASPNNG